MKNSRNSMEALSLHQYTIATGNWSAKSAATGFDESLYFKGIKQAMYMDEVVRNHIAVMDKYDPAKKLGLMVDEWGIWTDSEPGTNPGHLFQQNSMRDALIAALTFDIFHKYADRVQMANIAQVVNVLQAMILTQGDKMVLTPTYHVFKMYNVHQDATYLPVTIVANEFKSGEGSIPSISGTASRAKDGKVHISLSNFNPSQEVTIEVNLEDGNFKSVKEATLLTAPAFNSVNVFADGDLVKPTAFTNFKLRNNSMEVKLPAHSVVVLELL
jgi:alpha-N-arabinofuranosidase